MSWSCAGCTRFRLDGTDNHGPNGTSSGLRRRAGADTSHRATTRSRCAPTATWTVSVSTPAHPPRVGIALAPSPAMLRSSCRRAARPPERPIYCPTSVPARWSPAHLCGGCNGTFSATGWFAAPAGYVGQPGENAGHFTVWAAPPAKVRAGYVGCVNRTRSRPTRVGGHAAVWVVCPPGSTLDAGHVLLRWRGTGGLRGSLHSDTAANRNLLRRIAAWMTVVQP